MKKTLVTLALAVLTVLGCDGGGGGGGDAGATHPLVGAWGSTTCFIPDEQSDCDNEIIFGADGSYTNTSQYVKSSSSTTGFGGCTITLVASGYEWDADATRVSVSEGASPSGQTSRAGCDDPSDDQALAPAPDFSPVSFTFADQPYEITGSTLTIGGPGGLALTRR